AAPRPTPLRRPERSRSSDSTGWPSTCTPTPSSASAMVTESTRKGMSSLAICSTVCWVSQPWPASVGLNRRTAGEPGLRRARKGVGRQGEGPATGPAPVMGTGSGRTAWWARGTGCTVGPASAQPGLMPGDHQPLDLAGRLVDLGDLGVAEVALDRHLLRIAHAAVDLQRLVGDPHGGLRGGELGDRGLVAEALALALHPGRAQRQQQGRVELALHVGDLGLGHLEGADRRAEGLALLHVLDGGLVGRAGDADGLRRDADAARSEEHTSELQSRENLVCRLL